MLNVSLSSGHTMGSKPLSFDGSVFFLLRLDFTGLVMHWSLVMDAIKGIILDVEKIVGS